MIRPPILQPGDTIGLVATARKVLPADLNPAIQFLEQAGFKVKLPAGIFKTDFQFAGTDECRLSDLQELINDPTVKAIWCARGGYGTVRVLQQLDLSPLHLHPKWIIGFSDVTALLSRLFQEGIMSVHGPMAINWSADHPESGLFLDPFYKDSFVGFLNGAMRRIQVQGHPMNSFKGRFQGVLAGGNLSVLMSLSGSREDILGADMYIIEDLDEYIYHFDRMIQWLFRSGKLHPGKPLLVGHLSGMKDLNPENPFGKTPEQIIAETASKYNVPVIFGLPFGHHPQNDFWVLGGSYLVESDGQIVSIQEIPA